MERTAPGKTYLMHVARLGFVLLSMFMGGSIAVGYDQSWWVGSFWGFLFASAGILVEFSLRELTLRRFSHATVGLLMGLLGAWLITRIGFFRTKGLEEFEDAQTVFELMVFLGLGFLGMMLALRSNREEFSLLIPYVRLKRDALHEQQVVISGDVLADGRITRLYGCGLLSGELVIPRFVLDEIQQWEQSADRSEGLRGRRAMECLEQMRVSSRIDVIIHEDPIAEESDLEAKLIALTRRVEGRMLTGREGLARNARIQQVEVLLLPEIAAALKVIWKEGDEVEVNLVKEGKDAGQAIGYLPDGTMVVVNGAAKKIGSSLAVVISKAVKTSGGRLLFGEPRDA